MAKKRIKIEVLSDYNSGVRQYKAGEVIKVEPKNSESQRYYLHILPDGYPSSIPSIFVKEL